VGDRDARGHRDFHPGGLLVDLSDIVDQIIFGQTVPWIQLGLGARRAVDGAQMVSRDANVTGVAADHDRIPAQLAEIGVADRDCRGVLDRDGADPIELPVRAQQRFGGFEEGRFGVPERQILDPDVVRRRVLAFDPGQRFQPPARKPAAGGR
jgi:hypothetical protein